MEKSRRDYQVVPFPKVRLRIADFLRLQHRKHTIHGLIELDVTKPRNYIREHKARTGETLSFTAFLIGCLAKAVDEDKRMHAYRKGRRQLVLFDDVDVTTLVEHEVDGERIATPHVIRAANKKTFPQIHQDIRTAQERKATGFKKTPWREELFFSLPAFIRVFVLGMLGSSPHWRKKVEGTVVMTAVGMFGRGAGWGIPMTDYTLCVVLGGIAEKPGVVDGRIEVREYLNATITVDHDIVDGAPLARFSSRFRELVESGYALLEQTGDR
jgi:pyruvate/2-oxoglutarate dehydrogenase complex dihydrolipoamide acyltransferase (E2) component